MIKIGNLMRIHLIPIALLAILIAACQAAPSAQLPTMQAGTPASSAPPSPTSGLETAVPTTQALGCTAAKPEPTSTAPALVPAVSARDYTVGPADAAVTLIEYCDFQAPICRSMAAVVSNVVNNHPGDVRVVFRPVPLIDRLDKSALAVQAAIAAGNQEHFWEMYDLLFQKVDQWDSLSSVEFEAWLKQMASSARLDAGRFAADLKSQATVDSMNRMYEDARALDLQSVPLLVINGTPQGNFALDYTSIDSTVSLIALGGRQFTECPPFEIDPSREYTATLHTEKGDILLELYASRAPLAVNSFVFLARHGWFEDITFHRVIPGFVAQTGDPSGTGRGNPGYFFADEIDPSLKFDQPGVLAMANQGPNTNGSQFFITYAPAAHLDGQYTIFGRLISGMDVLNSLTPRDPEADPRAAPGDRLLSVEIQVK
jgi:cyclophilin family peptidyl-prolyl cis-trans isomerase/protein-disulfide isomerase